MGVSGGARGDGGVGAGSSSSTSTSIGASASTSMGAALGAFLRGGGGGGAASSSDESERTSRLRRFGRGAGAGAGSSSDEAARSMAGAGAPARRGDRRGGGASSPEDAARSMTSDDRRRFLAAGFFAAGALRAAGFLAGFGAGAGPPRPSVRPPRPAVAPPSSAAAARGLLRGGLGRVWMVRIARVAVLAAVLALVLVGAEVAELAGLPLPAAALALAFARLGHGRVCGSSGPGRSGGDGTTAAPQFFSTEWPACRWRARATCSGRARSSADEHTVCWPNAAGTPWRLYRAFKARPTRPRGMYSYAAVETLDSSKTVESDLFWRHCESRAIALHSTH